MFRISHYIEKILKKSLHKKRPHIIKKTLEAFAAKYHPDEQTLKDLEDKLQSEADRIYAIVDESILKERIKRANYTFWVTAVTGAILVIILSAFTGGAPIAFLIPILTALTAWIISVGTIPISYNHRVQGAMDSVVHVFEKSYQESKGLVTQELKVEVQNIQKQLVNILCQDELAANQGKEELNSIKELLIVINNKLDTLNNKIDYLVSETQKKNLETFNEAVSPDDLIQLKNLLRIKSKTPHNDTIKHKHLKKMMFWKHSESHEIPNLIKPTPALKVH